jgi:Spy/CpxP family protein refolding chaperone
MKSLLLLSALSFCLAAPAWAQSADASSSTDNSSTTDTSTTPKHHHCKWGGAGLTKDQWQELKAARDSALQANPDLKTEETQLRQEHKAHMKKMHDAMVQADPNVEPILTKLEAAHHHHHHHGDAAAAPSDDSNS